MHATLATTNSASRVRQTEQPRTLRFTTVEILILVLFALALIAAAVGPALMRDRSAPTHTTTIKVGEYQTLWEIAKQHPGEGLTTPETVRAIRTLNGMTSGNIVAGQLLMVPVNATSSASVALR